MRTVACTHSKVILFGEIFFANFDDGGVGEKGGRRVASGVRVVELYEKNATLPTTKTVESTETLQLVCSHQQNVDFAELTDTERIIKCLVKEKKSGKKRRKPKESRKNVFERYENPNVQTNKQTNPITRSFFPSLFF